MSITKQSHFPAIVESGRSDTVVVVGMGSARGGAGRLGELGRTSGVGVVEEVSVLAVRAFLWRDGAWLWPPSGDPGGWGLCSRIDQALWKTPKVAGMAARRRSIWRLRVSGLAVV